MIAKCSIEMIFIVHRIVKTLKLFKEELEHFLSKLKEQHSQFQQNFK